MPPSHARQVRAKFVALKAIKTVEKEEYLHDLIILLGVSFLSKFWFHQRLRLQPVFFYVSSMFKVLQKANKNKDFRTQR